MNCAIFRFYAELNDFLPQSRRQTTFKHCFNGGPAVKDTIESLGVPHTEVDLILVDGEPVGFDHLLQDGDRVSVYPRFVTLDLGGIQRLRPEPLRHKRFVLDIHLGKLANYLRMLGVDTLYRNDYADATLAEISRREKRVLLTRDRGLLKRSAVTYGYCVRSTRPREQLQEVVSRYALQETARPFSRCIRCNGMLEHVEKDEVEEDLPPLARSYYDVFRRCRDCHQYYWRGSHFGRMQRFIEGVLDEAGKG